MMDAHATYMRCVALNEGVELAMGYCNYLRRNDNRTLFDLGKIPGDEWAIALGNGTPTVMNQEDEDTLALVLAEDIATWGACDQEFALAYGQHVAKAIVAWCDGHPFEFCGEDSFENWQFDDTWDYDLAVTGTRHGAPGDSYTVT